MREYKTGSLWCFWRWKFIGYIDRLHVIQTPLGSICVHWLNYPDQEAWLHDHPVSFLSIILRGGYSETRSDYDVVSNQHRRWFNFLRASHQVKHRIYAVQPNTMTLCFMGPHRREWGFHAPGRWVRWKDYYREFKDTRRKIS